MENETPEQKSARLKREIEAHNRELDEIEAKRALEDRKAKELRKQQERERKQAEKEAKKQAKYQTPKNIKAEVSEGSLISSMVAFFIALGILFTLLGFIGLIVNGFLQTVVPYSEGVDHWYIWIFEAYGIFNGILILIVVIGFLCVFIGIIIKILQKIYRFFYRKIRKISIKTIQVRIPESIENLQLVESQEQKN
jgi:uncharacterized membrane protein YdbT with pleckstrin-like domain